MIQTIIRRKFQLLVLVLGLGVLALVACGSNAATASPGDATAGQQGDAAELADLLRSQIGSSSLQEILGGPGNPQGSTSSGIWVNGQGQVSAEPDLAVLRLGVSALASTVAEARSYAATQLGEVIEVLGAQAIADRDIQTTFFNINPRFTTIEVTKCQAMDELEEPRAESQSSSPDEQDSLDEVDLAPVPSISVEIEEISSERRSPSVCNVERQRVIEGFEVTNQLTVKVRDLDSVGGVIDEVVEAGGNLIRFQGVSFTIEDTEELQDQARALAFKNLMDKAAQVADLAGVELGQVLFISETGGPSVVSTVRSEALSLAQSAAPTPILAGELDVVVTMQAAFDIVGPAS